ncbi:MAG: DUF29 family protein, partial [Pseudanabaena sp.]
MRQSNKSVRFWRVKFMTQAITKLSLYDRDQHLWLEEAIAKLRVKDFQSLDLVHLIEELEIVAGRDRA